MAKFFGKVGFITSKEEPAGSGIWIEEPTEYQAYGDVLLDNVTQQVSENLNDDLRLNNRLSIVSDPYITRNVHAIRYVTWVGGYWAVRTVEVRAPRLILNLGGVYNGRTVPAPDPPGDDGGEEGVLPTP